MNHDRPAVREMSRYIDTRLYHEVERTHPFYVEMLEEIFHHLSVGGVSARPRRLLEWGAGTGIVTEDLVRLSNLDVTALEFDTECCDLLRAHVHGSACKVVQGDVLTYEEDEAFDIVLSVFAHDHIHHDKAGELVRSIRRNLKPGGLYIMGGEILRTYANAEERREALLDYHGFIVDTALRQGHYRVAQIEINALYSGVEMIGDFKRHERMFEGEMEAGGFTPVLKKKIGPAERDDVGGVFVYIYQAP